MDTENMIILLREEVSRLNADMANLKGWQKTQNGSLVRIDEKVQGIYKILLGTASTAALSFLGTIITLITILINLKK